MPDLPKIAVIPGSTRDSRWADVPTRWLMGKIAARDDMTAEVVDIRDFQLPLFNEMASNLWMPSSDPHAVAWQNKVAEFDGYVFVTPEYNHSITGALKNALDQCYKEWNRKPMAALGYGSVGAARAIEHLRLIAVELQMVPVWGGANIGGADFFKVHPLGANQPIETIEETLMPSVAKMLGEVVWYANALRVARMAQAA